MTSLFDNAKHGDVFVDDQGSHWHYQHASKGPGAIRHYLTCGIAQYPFTECGNDIGMAHHRRILRKVIEPVFEARLLRANGIWSDWLPCPRDAIIRHLQSGGIIECRTQG